MMISTRGRYALRVLLDLAQHDEGQYIPMKEVAQRQDVSLKYLERIIPALVRDKYIEGIHGKGGGYRLTASPDTIRIGDILRLTEGDLAPVSCLECGSEPCQRIGECRTIEMWAKFNALTNEFFDGITIAELMR